ncbi:MAG: biotin transporter BioY [Verrucomicrobia bacterium]|nr:biotin transporter BioY [Verrucomicrobiota bacterium]
MDVAVAKKTFNASLSKQATFDLLQIALAACFMAICSQIKIPLPFTPVPLSVQPLGPLLLGALLGSRKGALATFFCLVLGCVGLPVWSGGAAGLAHFMGPTGGYIIGYVAQAYFVGWCFERQSSANMGKIIAILFLSTCLQLTLGSLWLAQFVGMKGCFMLGFYPFIAVDTAKTLCVALYLRKKVAHT